MDIIQRIKSLLPIESLITTPIVSSNKGKMTNCPLHEDRTPSFRIEHDRFYCFSCGAKGDAINLLALINRTSIKNAIRIAINMCGIQQSKPKEPYIFEKALKSHTKQTMAYLEKRGVKDISNIGYNFPVANRITFPVYNWHNEIVGFVTHNPSSNVRYSNSAESDRFKKTELLFNHTEARKLGRSFVYLVEGVFDAILLTQSGRPAVAMMGTTTSEHALRKLMSEYLTINVFLDNDDAGRKGTKAIVKKICSMLKHNTIRIVQLSDRKDPADYMQNGGTQPTALSLVDYLVSVGEEDALETIPDAELRREFCEEAESKSGKKSNMIHLLECLHTSKDKFYPKENETKEQYVERLLSVLHGSK